MCALRALALYLGLQVSAIVVFLGALLLRPVSARFSRAALLCWNRFALWWARGCCGIHYRVAGQEHIPASGPYLVVSNHQSAYETILFVLLFPRSVPVVKRALLRIPFFGWGLRALGSIPIDRGSPASSMRRLFAAAKDRFDNDHGLVMFPEGTRLEPGAYVPWHAGAVHVACRFGVPVLPVAHNAGHAWPKGLCKRPGTVEVHIGPVLDPQGRTAAELNRTAQQWVEQARGELRPPG